MRHRESEPHAARRTPHAARCTLHAARCSLLAAGDAIRVEGVDPAEVYVAFARQKTPDSRAAFQVSAAPEAVKRRRPEWPPCKIGLQTLYDLWTDAGLSKVRTARLDISQAFSSFDEFWQPFTSGCTPFSAFAAAVDRETWGKLANELRRIVPNLRPDGSFTLPARALAAAGTVGR